MKNKFVKAASIRAVKTIAQTLLSSITVGQALSDINWVTMLSISIVAGFCSILTSIITGLPETQTNGELILEKNEDGMPQLRLNVDQIQDGMKVIIKDETMI